MPPVKYTVLTRDAAGNAAWRRVLERHHQRVYELPCIRTEAAEITPEIRAVFSRLPDFRWIIFTSAAGVHYFAELAVQLEVDRRTLTGITLASVGPQTSDQIKSLGLVVSFAPSRPEATTLARELKAVKDREVLMVHTNIAPPEPARILQSRGARVTELPVYQTVAVTDPDDTFNQLLQNDQIGHIVFASPSAVAAFCQRLPESLLETVRNISTLAIGPGVAASLTAAGFRHVLTARTPNVHSLISLIE